MSYLVLHMDKFKRESLRGILLTLRPCKNSARTPVGASLFCHIRPLSGNTMYPFRYSLLRYQFTNIGVQIESYA